MTRTLLSALTSALAGALVLRWAAPGPADVLAALRSPQDWVGLHGADRAVLVVAALIGWLVLLWLAAAVAVVAAGALPGLAGRVARGLAALVVPAALRQGLALTLGIGLVVAGAASATAGPGDPRADTPGGGGGGGPGASVDWPGQPPVAPTPTPPVGPPPVSHPPGFGDPIDGGVDGIVVRAGDSLWVIAADQLGSDASDPAIAATVQDWYVTNRAVIGPDPDLIRPGQLLLPPEAAG